MINAQDKEIQLYRDLVKVPTKFEEGFGVKMVVAALFMGFLMVPASIYLGLFMGAGLGPAAQWVTVILFAEVARRSMKELKQQEIFLLFYLTGMALGGPYQGFLWNQYFVQSPAAIGMGVAQEVPSWVAPSAQVLSESGRTFFTRAWLAPIAFVTGLMLIGRIDQFGLGYALYRWTAHVEKLPFPMAPMQALGISALSESADRSERWKWRCFSLGGVIGLGFGLIYVGIPAITGTLFHHPVKVIPIPWLDLTPAIATKDHMQAVPLNLVFDIGLIIIGMVLPFWAVMGGAVGLAMTWIMNPILYRNGMLPSWQPGMGVVETLFRNQVDFYLSFGIGLAGAIFLVSLWPIFMPLIRRMRAQPNTAGLEQERRRTMAEAWRELMTRNKERGDISIVISLLIYVGSSVSYLTICYYLIDGFPVIYFAGFAFIYQPIISYVNAKLEGMVGQVVGIPLLREAAFILSGYKGAAIWFAPIPLGDYSGSVRFFRTMELTGNKLTGIIKLELMAIPIVLITTLLFSEMIWRLAPVPSEVYPFTQEVWHLNALNQSLTYTATLEGSSMFLEAIKVPIIIAGGVAGVLSFMLLSFLNLPTFLVYGAVRGLGGTTPGGLVFELVGALVGRFYLEKKFGAHNYKRYVSVVAAGFAAGVGLIGMASVAIALIAKSTTTLGY